MLPLTSQCSWAAAQRQPFLVSPGGELKYILSTKWFKGELAQGTSSEEHRMQGSCALCSASPGSLPGTQARISAWWRASSRLRGARQRPQRQRPSPTEELMLFVPPSQRNQKTATTIFEYTSHLWLYCICSTNKKKRKDQRLPFVLLQIIIV